MGSDLTCVVCPAGAATNEYDCVDFPSSLLTRNLLHAMCNIYRPRTREEVMTFMIEQFQEGETNNGLLLGFVLKEMDTWVSSHGHFCPNSVLAHFRVG